MGHVQAHISGRLPSQTEKNPEIKNVSCLNVQKLKEVEQKVPDGARREEPSEELSRDNSDGARRLKPGACRQETYLDGDRCEKFSHNNSDGARRLTSAARRQEEDPETVYIQFHDGTRRPLYSASLQAEINSYFSESESEIEREYKPVAPFPAALARKKPLKSHKDILGSFRDIEENKKFFQKMKKDQLEPSS